MVATLRGGAVFALGALAACDDVFSDPPTLDLPTNGTTTVTGSTRGASFVGVINDGLGELAEAEGPSAGTVQFVTENGEIVGLSIQTDRGRSLSM